MPRGATKIARATMDRGRSVAEPSTDISSLQADYLKDMVCVALAALSVEERSSVGKKLLAALERAGVGVRQSLLMLGTSARTADELTAPEIAAFVRYVRLTKPEALVVVAGPLSELVIAAESQKATNLAA